MNDRHFPKSMKSKARGWLALFVSAIFMCLTGYGLAYAQQTATPAPSASAIQLAPSAQGTSSSERSSVWSTDVEKPAGSSVGLQTAPSPATPPAVPGSSSNAAIKLVALLTTGGAQITKGLIWRIYKLNDDALNAIASPAPKLLSTHRISTPGVSLSPGTYAINVSYGLANLTRKIKIISGANRQEDFILNAGGLRLQTLLSDGSTPAAGSISYDVFSDQRNQFGERTRIISNIKPGIVLRLNAGIYFIKSRYGEANSDVSADVSVEAGKLTAVSLTHSAARVRLKLVTRSGGEALADARWTLETAGGVFVLKTVGAIPSYILATGAYVVTVRYGADVLKRTFSVAAGQDVDVEVIMP